MQLTVSTTAVKKKLLSACDSLVKKNKVCKVEKTLPMLQIHQYLEEEGEAIFFDTDKPTDYFFITAMGSWGKPGKNDIAVTTAGAFSSRMCEPLDYDTNGPTFNSLDDLKIWIIENRRGAKEPGSTYDDARKFFENLGVNGWNRQFETVAQKMQEGDFLGKVKLLEEFSSFPVVSGDKHLSKKLSDLQKIARLGEKYSTKKIVTL